MTQPQPTAFSLEAQLIDLHSDSIYPVRIHVSRGIIDSIERIEGTIQGPFILPGFVDAHVHIESSMLIPSEFARLAVRHGTVATVSDPHEIANVMGVEGVNYMIENGTKVPFHFFFGAPSCVPATAFETAGAVISSEDINLLMQRREILYLAEMMNFPGVIQKDPEVLAKINAAHRNGKPVDGHAPGLRGEALKRYFEAGISSDHECFQYEEGLEKLHLGMKVWIREGSAARNFEALIPLLHEFPEMIAFCSDDLHPDSLLEGHINLLVKRALEKGHKLFSVLRAASVNTIKHYNLPVGMLRAGDPADFIVVDDLEHFQVQRTYIKGCLVAEKGKSYIAPVKASVINNFKPRHLVKDVFRIKALTNRIRVIEALDGQLITPKLQLECLSRDGYAISDTERDILKIAVINRYSDAPPALGFIRNFGLKRGAIASCVAHDCHNIVAVGTNDADLCTAVNLIMEARGGISLADDKVRQVLALPVGGIMTNRDGFETADLYTAIDLAAKNLGTPLRAPFMSLSFMALLVIPHLKLSDRGLFDGNLFEFVDLFE
ncbi:MAG: adenine deaminase [Bacteroidia bacterium]